MALADNNAITLLLVLVAIALVAQLLLESRAKKKREPKYATKTLLKCTKCGYTIETDYEPGDFVGLIKRRCPKCGEPMIVYGIYDIEIKEKS